MIIVVVLEYTLLLSRKGQVSPEGINNNKIYICIFGPTAQKHDSDMSVRNVKDPSRLQ